MFFAIVKKKFGIKDLRKVKFKHMKFNTQIENPKQN